GRQRARNDAIRLSAMRTNCALGDALVVSERPGLLQKLVDQGGLSMVDVRDDRDIYRVHGDRELLTQMFANLVENALRHCPPGTTINLTVTRRGERVLASVADNGPGIPPGEREKVFQRLYRLDHSRSTPGSGLGLSLVRAIADLHGATIAL
ncbi:ATP-binding protein, partial [Mesorhizobium sp. M1C.F.Ca.ET.187.01.1.1]